MASNAQVSPEAGLAGGNSTSTFVPSRTAVIVNTLWYLSLSLSIATSLIAMLAKDWCRSFLANRTGDLYSQSQRRQRKWAMIERWKMHELILMLPSLIHLSLLLFAVGLCITVWELNHTVAIPVICVTGIAGLFYIWSSIAASILESFPYTTIVSTINRSQVMLKLYKLLAPLLTLLLFPVGIVALLSLLPLIGLSGVVVFCLWRLVAFFVGWFVKISALLQSLLHSYQMGLIELARTYMTKWYYADYINYGIFYRAESWLEEKRQNPSERDNNLGDNANTSEALKWLIENCENPDSTSIGLQAISGATSQLPREPLQY
ncbi:hypothetical protein B0J17DRAFT_682002 [Rhizoctonia solani]|nr:hypothetical protein B0J17DRAFT_682002 [Rhizoctonia solani]